MPTVKSAMKHLKTSIVQRELNRQRRSKMRTEIKKLRKMADYAQALEILPQVISIIDKNAKVKIISRHTAARYKSRLTQFVTKLRPASAK